MHVVPSGEVETWCLVTSGRGPTEILGWMDSLDDRTLELEGEEADRSPSLNSAVPYGLSRFGHFLPS